MVSQQTIRRIILTGAVTAITVTGALYGAGLKTQQEYQQVWLSEGSRELAPAFRICSVPALAAFATSSEAPAVVIAPGTNRKSQARKTVYELPIEERIAGLETKRARLVSQKHELERKIAEIESRRAASPKTQTTD
ncbi:hypothetical protein MPH_04837 [Macrophomina phaseolina MS6]|uniref:Uncharacterized protein n=1 Tax=Macrophomina phaseolina (strain MS6) TaxID=1126212 RepID=K2RT02_MACPH|nr:hypothetical protein MPH_04837 [Macrophomina phaseolina MS6]